MGWQRVRHDWATSLLLLGFPYKLWVFLSLDSPCGSAGKESTCNAGDSSLIPGLGRSPGEGNGYPPQYSGLENSMDCIVHGVAKSWTQLSHFYFHFSFHYLWVFIKRSTMISAGILGGQKQTVFIPAWKQHGEKKNLRGSSIQELRDYQVITTKQSAKRKEIGPQSQIDGQDVNNNRFNLWLFPGYIQKYLMLWNLVKNWFPAVNNVKIPHHLCLVKLPKILLHNLVKDKTVCLILQWCYSKIGVNIF